MKHCIFILIMFWAAYASAQNLLLNPSFEDTLPRTTPAYAPVAWISPTEGSPDYFVPFKNSDRTSPNNFAGYQEAHSGTSYLGILIYNLFEANDSKRFREYSQSQLVRALAKDSIYCFQIHVSLADSFIYASKNKLGVYFSNAAIGSNDFFSLPYTPQIIISPDSFITEKEEWLEFTFQYQAQGGEEYVTIGNFNDSSEVDTLNIGGGNPFDANNIGTYYYIDDVYLGSCDSLPFDTNVGLRENDLLQRYHRVYPNPTTSQFQLELLVSPNEQIQLQLYDVQGKLQLKQVLQATNVHSIDVAELPKGLYVYRVVNSQGASLAGKLMVE